MKVAFDQLSDDARVWVYQANRSLDLTEMDQISQYLAIGIADWAAHGNSLLGSFEIQFSQVIIIAVDEQLNQASGCSIDTSSRWFKDLGAQLNIDFFDRSCGLVLGNSLQLIPISQVKSAIQSGLITPESHIIPLQTPSLAQYRNNWLTLAKNSWLSRYFTSQTV